MTIVKLVNQARQLLGLLDELEAGNAYDLHQLAEHLGAQSNEELDEVVSALEAQGCIAVINKSNSTFIALKSMDFDPGLVVEKSAAPKPSAQPEQSIIGDTSVDLISTPAAERGTIKTKVEVAELEKPKPKPSAAEHALGQLTIGQVLLSLASAIENTTELDNSEKWPLVEKLKSVAGHQSIQKWLKTPLKNMVG